MHVIEEERVPEITELRFDIRGRNVILVGRFADGAYCWVGWNCLPIRYDTNPASFWFYLMAKLEMSVQSLERFYLRDVKRIPRFQRRTS